MIRISSKVFGLLLSVLLLCSCTEDSDHAMHASKPAIEISNAWAGESPPTMAMNAGYFSIINHGDKAVELVAASSPAYSKIEIHQSFMKEGVAGMSMLESVTVESHQQVLFESGGLHLMMFNPIEPMKAGDSFDVQLTFADGATASFQMQVAKLNRMTGDKSGSGNGHHHHHHGM